MKLYLTHEGSVQDVTQLTGTVKWSGDIKSCVRTLDVTLISSATDPILPQIQVGLGDHISFFAPELLFDGFVVKKTGTSSGNTMDLVCYDRGFYLNKNQGNYKFQDTTPEGIAAQIAADFGFSTGELAETGYQISRNFFGVPLYKIITTAYTLAAGETGSKYKVGFVGDKLAVFRKAAGSYTLVIQGGSNLLNASVSETIEQLCNRVVIADKSGTEKSVQEDAESQQSYGAAQVIIQDGETAESQAKAALEASSPTQAITLECLGDTRSITGRMVAVREPHTGLWGSFWIDSDAHVWKNGVYTNKLRVSFDNIMDEAEAGEVVKSMQAAQSGSGDQSGAGTWAYYREG